MTGRQSPQTLYETEMGDLDGGASITVELEADLNADPTDEFVTTGERKGSGHEWTCNCYGGKFSENKRKLKLHIAGKNFSTTGIQCADMHFCVSDQDQGCAYRLTGAPPGYG